MTPRPRHQLARRIATLALLVAVVLVPALEAAPAGAQTGDAGALLARARADFIAGRHELARERYLDAATSPGAPATVAQAAWAGLVSLANAREEPAAAAALSRAGLRQAGPEAGERIQYLGALAVRDAGLGDHAALLFRSIVARRDVLAPMARFRLGQALSAADRDAEAAVALGLAASDPALTPSLRTIGREEGATVFEAIGRPLDALALLETGLEDANATPRDLASVRWRIAQLQRQAGNPAWADHARAVLADAPRQPEAASALEALRADAAFIPPLDEAYVHYLARRDAEARALYEGVVGSAPSPADAHVAWFYLGAIDERSGTPDAVELAIAGYDNCLAAQPDGRLADDALWWSAALFAREDSPGDDLEAGRRLEQLAISFPASPFAVDAAIRAPLALAEAGDMDQARARLGALVEAGGVGAARRLAAMAARWLTVLGGPSIDPAGFDPAALPTLIHHAGPDATAPLDPALNREWLTPIRPTDAEAADARSATDAWMAANMGARPAQAGALLDPRIELARTLAEVNETTVARGIGYSLVTDYEGRPYDLLDVARASADAGLADVSIDAALTLLQPFAGDQRLSVPRELLRLVYPLPYANELTRAAELEAVPSLLLAAIVRQESRFDPLAGSSAGANGLTQVIAPTGEAIAKSLDRPWNPADLARPSVSLRYGAHYLAAQLDAFDGNVFAALAAYNGGPGNALRWLDEQRWPGADGFVEAVDFNETRHYLETVLENYGWYRYLYAGLPAPAIR